MEKWSFIKNLLYLLEKGVDVYGFDFSEVSVEYAKAESKKIIRNLY